MSSLVFLVPISLALLGIAIGAFVWAVRRGQFDDLETPAVQILMDEPREEPCEPTSTDQAAESDADTEHARRADTPIATRRAD